MGIADKVLDLAKNLINDPAVRATAQAFINSILAEKFGMHESGRNMLDELDIDRLTTEQ